MSIAAISSSFVSAVRTSATSVTVDPVGRASAPQRSGREHGQRHELVDAVNQALGVDGEQSKDEAQAVFRFAHALMHDLRSIDAGAAPGPGRGHAWGRRDWSDLPQRIDALATAAGTPATEPQAPAQAQVVSAGTAPPPAADAAAAVDLPPLPNPATATSAAVHLMQVPSSRLLEAYTALREAIGNQSGATPTGNSRGDLAAFLDRLSNQLAPDAAAALPAGSVLNVTA